VGDSSSFLTDRTEKQTQTILPKADTAPEPAPAAPAIVYKEVEVPPSSEQQTTESPREHRDKDRREEPTLETVTLSRTPRDSNSILRLESLLPECSQGSRNVSRGSVHRLYTAR